MRSAAVGWCGIAAAGGALTRGGALASSDAMAVSPWFGRLKPTG
jgi:hypothetical protein